MPALIYEFLGSVWFTEMGSDRPIGIVLIDNGTEEEAFIGTGLGVDEKTDIRLIAARGAKFPVEVAKMFIKY